MNIFYFPGPHGSQAHSLDNGLEFTQIPTARSRWQEESTALDGHAPHLIMAVLRDTIIQRLTEIYKKESTAKDSAAAGSGSAAKNKSASGFGVAAPTSSSSGSTSTVPQIVQQTREGGVVAVPVPLAPHSSDQVTPSSWSPRDPGSSSVDQLRSSLRQVADALAQTVEAVRTTREQLLGERGMAGGGVSEGDREEGVVDPRGESHEHQPLPPPPNGGGTEDASSTIENSTAMLFSSAEDENPANLSSSLSLSTPLTTSTTTTSSSIVLPIHSTFDGSQESAVATLATTDPNDPLHTFLSAIVGAPAPPLPETSPAPSYTSPQPLPPPQSTPASSEFSTATSLTSTTSPRLPVFTQLLHSDPRTENAHQNSIPMSVIQDTRGTGTGSETSTEPPILESIPESISESSNSTANDFALQMSSFFSQHPRARDEGETMETTTTTISSSRFVQELARVVSQFSSSTSSVSTSISSSSSQPLVPSIRTGGGGGGGELATVQSPSPSDMLAPLFMSSLQMPAGNGEGGEGGVAQVSAMEQVSDASISTDQNRTPQVQALQSQGQQVLPPPRSRPLPNLPLSTLEAVYHHMTNPGQSESSGPLSPSSAAGITASVAPSMLTPATTSDTHAVVSTTRQGGGMGVGLRSDSTTIVTTTSQGATATPQTATTPIDPTFLAALPDSIRQEVMAQHEREQRLLRARREASFMSSISPEFLSALPPNIQEEVRMCVCVCIIFVL